MTFAAAIICAAFYAVLALSGYQNGLFGFAIFTGVQCGVFIGMAGGMWAWGLMKPEDRTAAYREARRKAEP